MSQTTRINKYLAENGYCSRREADRLIKAGKVFINEAQAHLGDVVNENDDVRVLGRDKKVHKKNLYILLHKPIGYTTKSGVERNVMELIDVPERVFPVGRLNPQTTGLLLLTNDGTLASRLINPKYQIEQEYVVDVEPSLRPVDVGRLGKIGKTRLLSPSRCAIVVRENHQREIHQACEELGYRVLEFMRTRIGTLKMPTTYPEGNFRHLTEKEVRDLKKIFSR
ncbi:rRNA pseudouridine synthase [Candidatus Uhrbacteria bacterium]|nr:rRNA pseudouridine synthase [Candidatus Uhrbacteria bacterium]